MSLVSLIKVTYNSYYIQVDLRDGVRLARLMELLTHTGDISAALRVPAVSRLQKLHNVGLVFKKFKGIKLAGGEGKGHAFLDYHNFHLQHFSFFYKK